MSPRNWEKRIKDILQCARNIQAFTAEMTQNSFINDQKSIRAVAFEFVTMGEAARAIPVEVREAAPTIPWEKMQGIRNVLVHEYFRLDEEILWEASQRDIPELIEELERFLKIT